MRTKNAFRLTPLGFTFAIKNKLLRGLVLMKNARCNLGSGREVAKDWTVGSSIHGTQGYFRVMYIGIGTNDSSTASYEYEATTVKYQRFPVIGRATRHMLRSRESNYRRSDPG